jgi:outer membrane immunogenic protein
MTTERVRLGYAMDRTLFFLTGGYAGIQTHGTYTDFVNGLAGSQNRWQSGGVVGAGLEYAITNNITLKGEYLYAPTFSRTYFVGTPDAVNTGLGLSMFRAGLNYKF